MSDTSDLLRSVVSRIQRLEEEIKGLNADKSDVYKEAGGAGLDVPALRTLIQELRDPPKANEKRELVELYRANLESGTPRATRARAEAA